jgi:hypothetical protein
MSGITANLNDADRLVDTGNDSIVIVHNLETLPGGKTLDTTGFTPEVIPGGHLIIEETSTGNLKPMPVSGSDYAALPASHTYKGILVSSILTAKPFAAVMLRGTVNKNASVYTTDSVLVAAKAALPLIRFTQD